MKKQKKQDNRLISLDFHKFVLYIMGVVNKEYRMDRQKNEALIKMLEEKRDDLLNQVQSIETTIKITRQSFLFEEVIEKPKEKIQARDFNVNFTDGYKLNWSVNSKIKFLIKKENKFLHNKQISELISLRENHIDPKKLSGQLSANLSNLKSEGVLAKIQIGKSRRNTFWGLKEWKISENSIKPGHEYDEKYLLDPVDEEIEL